MSASAGHRLDTWIRHATPFAITLLLTLVALVPLHVPGLVRITPMLTLIAIYHWAVLRPDLLPACLAAADAAAYAGAIEKRGVLPGELCVPLSPFLSAVRARGIEVKERPFTFSAAEEVHPSYLFRAPFAPAKERSDEEE